MQYNIETLRIENVSFDPRHENNLGLIVIGGDKCDVYADSATYEEIDGKDPKDECHVTLNKVTVINCDEYLEDMHGRDLYEEVVRLAEDTVRFSHDSIASDCFIPCKKHGFPKGECRHVES